VLVTLKQIGGPRSKLNATAEAPLRGGPLSQSPPGRGDHDLVPRSALPHFGAGPAERGLVRTALVASAQAFFLGPPPRHGDQLGLSLKQGQALIPAEHVRERGRPGLGYHREAA
jgi:hypothetical protein